jgi:hypothetical protein
MCISSLNSLLEPKSCQCACSVQSLEHVGKGWEAVFIPKRYWGFEWLLAKLREHGGSFWKQINQYSHLFWKLIPVNKPNQACCLDIPAFPASDSHLARTSKNSCAYRAFHQTFAQRWWKTLVQFQHLSSKLSALEIAKPIGFPGPEIIEASYLPSRFVSLLYFPVTSCFPLCRRLWTKEWNNWWAITGSRVTWPMMHKCLAFWLFLPGHEFQRRWLWIMKFDIHSQICSITGKRRL